MKRHHRALAAAATAVVAAAVLAGPAGAASVRAYGPVPSPNTGSGQFGAEPHDLAPAEGAIWFTEFRDGEVGRLDPSSGVVTEFSPPPSPPGRSAGQETREMLYDAGRNRVWWTEHGAGRIGWLDPRLPAPPITEVDVGDRGPNGLALAPDGALWMTLRTTGEILRYNPDTGAQTRYSLIAGDGSVLGLEGIGIDGAGRAWIAALEDNAVWFLNPATANPNVPGSGTARYPLGAPVAISISPNGQVWTGAIFSKFLVRMQPSLLIPGNGTAGIRGFAVNANPHGVLASSDEVWFADYGDNLLLRNTAAGGTSIGRFVTATNTAEIFPLLPGPVPDLHPQRIERDANGDIWVTETKANRLSVLDLGTANIPGATPVTSTKVALPAVTLPGANSPGAGFPGPGATPTRLRVGARAVRVKTRRAGRRVPTARILIKGAVRPRAGAAARRPVLVQRRVRRGTRNRWVTVRRRPLTRKGTFRTTIRFRSTAKLRVRVRAGQGFRLGRTKVITVRALRASR